MSPILAAAAAAIALLINLGEEKPLNPLDVLAAMGSRATGCVSVKNLAPVEGEWPGAIFVTDTPQSGGWIGTSEIAARIPPRWDVYQHPSHSIALAFPSTNYVTSPARSIRDPDQLLIRSKLNELITSGMTSPRQ